jgi:hypothetical protein
VSKDLKADVAAARKNWQTVTLMRTGLASSPGRLGASLLAVMLCAVLAQPAQALTSNTRFTSAVTVTKETAYTGVFEGGVEAHTGLFVCDNPVNRIDPSGYMSSLDAAKYGRMLHTKLGEDFVDKMEPFGVFGPSIATILKLPDTVTALFPDLVNINPANKEVYEIKPVGVGIAAGYLQLEGYLQVFNYFDPIKTWKPGSTYTPPLEVTLDPLTYALVSPPVRGVIIYELFSVKDFAKKRALNVAESESADIEDSVGISTLTTIIAF